MAEDETRDPIDARRRRLLLKIGAASLAAYAAPVVLNLSGEARASDDRSDDRSRDSLRSDERRGELREGGDERRLRSDGRAERRPD